MTDTSIRKKITVIIPAYNEQAVVEECIRRVTEAMQALHDDRAPEGFDYRILFVNDGSSDNTECLIAAECEKDPHIQLISFARNFGHQIAVTAGIDYALKDCADAVVIMDADLQDPPSVIQSMVTAWCNGYEVAYGQRIDRQGETAMKKSTAHLFYRTLNKLTGLNMPVDTGDFRLMDRAVCEVIHNMPEHDRYLRGMVSWVGFKSCPIKFHRQARFAGETHYPLKKQLKLALNAILSFSYAPFWIILAAGLCGLLGGFVTLVLGLICKCPAAAVSGVVVACTGFLSVVCGILGLYIGRIYEETKGRPLYIVGHCRNIEK